MPNWVYNYLTVEGSKEDIAKLKAQVGATVKTKYKSADEVDEEVDRETEYTVNVGDPFKNLGIFTWKRYLENEKSEIFYGFFYLGGYCCRIVFLLFFGTYIAIFEGVLYFYIYFSGENFFGVRFFITLFCSWGACLIICILFWGVNEDLL